MKQATVLILVVSMLLFLAACAAPADTVSETPVSTIVSATPEPTEAPTPTPEPTPELEPTPIDLLGEKYNPFYAVEWPEGYTVNECRIGYVDVGEESEIESMEYNLGLYVDGDIYEVIEYFSNFVGDPQDLYDIIEEYPRMADA